MGFWSREEEFAGLNSIEILKGNRVNPADTESYSIANETAIASILLNNPNDMEAYRQQYMITFKRRYRESFSSEGLANHGFLPITAPVEFPPPETSGSDNAYVNFINSSVNPKIDTIKRLFRTSVSIENQSRCMLQEIYDLAWNNNTKILSKITIDGITDDWKLYDTVTDYTKINIVMQSIVTGNFKNILIDNILKKYEQGQTIQYLNNEYGDRWFLKVIKNTDIPSGIMETTYVTCSPIVPIKEDNIMNPNDRDVINTLDDLGVDGKELRDNLILTCPESYEPPPDSPEMDCDESIKIPSTIDNAYVFTGIHTGSDDSAVDGGLFHWFEVFAGVQGGKWSISIHEKFDLSYSFSCTHSVHSGVIASPTQYTKTIAVMNADDDINSGETMILRRQIDEGTYEELLVEGFEQYWAIIKNGVFWEFSSGLTYDKGGDNDNGKIVESRLIIPLDMYNNVDYDIWVPIHETGMIMVAYTNETIKLKWWQTGIFKILIIIVVSIVTWGSGTPIITMLINAAIAMAIGMVASFLASMVDSEFLQVIIFVVAAAAAMYVGGFDFNNMSGFDNFLKMADQAITAYNKAEEMQVAAASVSSKEDILALEEENEELQEEIKAMKGVNATLYIKDYDMDICSSPPGGIIPPEAYFRQKLGGDIYDFNTLFDVDSVYARKKNVKT